MSKRIFHLSCHCQANILRITFPESVKPFEKNQPCDCSYCLKRRVIWTFVPAGASKVLRGMDKLQTYQFGAKQLYHQSCGECGSYLLATFGTPKIDVGEKMYLNLRCIRDDHFDLWKYPLEPMYYAKEGTQYAHTTLEDIPGAKEYLDKRAAASDHPTEVLVGACHCKAIKFAVATEKLGTGRMNDCACSICSGNGSLWIYPFRQNVFFSPSEPGKPYQPLDSTISTYGYYKKENLMWNCKVCSCNLYEAEPEEVLDKEPLEKQTIGLNISLLSNIGEWFDDVSGLSWNEEERIEGYSGRPLSGQGSEDKSQNPYKKLESMKRGRGMKFAGPPHYKLDLEGLDGGADPEESAAIGVKA